MKDKAAKYKSTMEDAQKAAMLSYQFIEEQKQKRDYFENEEIKTHRMVDDAFESLRLCVEDKKQQLKGMISTAFSDQKVSMFSVVAEISNLQSEITSTLEHSSLSFVQLSNELAAKRDSITRLLRLTKIRQKKIEIPKIEFTDSFLDDIIRAVKGIFSQLSVFKPRNITNKSTDRPATPGRGHINPPKARQDSRSGSFAQTPIPPIKEMPSTPRVQKDQTKKSTTRSKSPIFNTDIRRL